MRRPEQDATTDDIVTPAEPADMIAMRGDPLAHDRLGHRHALFARRGGGKIAQPGEALHMRREGIGDVERREIKIGERNAFATEAEHPAEHRLPRAQITDDRIVGHREQLQREATAQAKTVQRRAPGQAVETVGEAIGQRQTLVAIEPNQPLAFLDPVGGGIDRDLPAHPPLRRRILSA